MLHIKQKRGGHPRVLLYDYFLSLAATFVTAQFFQLLTNITIPSVTAICTLFTSLTFFTAWSARAMFTTLTPLASLSAAAAFTLRALWTAWSLRPSWTYTLAMLVIFFLILASFITTTFVHSYLLLLKSQ